MTCLDIGGTPSFGRANASNIGDAGGFNQRHTDIKLDENEKDYIPGTGSHPTGIPIGDSSQWRR